MRKAIFDLDQTLIDTRALSEARRSGNWLLTYSLIPQCALYEGIERVFENIRRHGLCCSIVSSAPRSYVERVVSFFDIPITKIIGYHDAFPGKPNPAPMLKALELMGCPAHEAISFGDRAIDIMASNAAGIESVACFWGTEEKPRLLRSGYSHAIVRPEEILTLIR